MNRVPVRHQARLTPIQTAPHPLTRRRRAQHHQIRAVLVPGPPQASYLQLQITVTIVVIPLRFLAVRLPPEVTDGDVGVRDFIF